MQKFSLCSHCASRFDKGPAVILSSSDGECHICRGACSRTRQLLEAALPSANAFEWSTFSVSSSFQKALLAREDDVAEYFQPGQYTSMKNWANALLAKEISSATGKKNSQRAGEAVFSFDFSSGSARAVPSPIYVFGRYQKLSRSHCQSRWHCSDCGGRGCNSCGGSGTNYPSVEEELCKAFSQAFSSSGCILHASGREDVDVRCLNTGRPFVLEIKNPKKRSADLAALELEFKKNPNVRALGLKTVGKHFLDAVCNSHFEKEYSALVSADRALSHADAEKIKSLSGKVLHQQTPTRVLARRSDMERRRRIFKISATEEGEGRLRLRILAEAGTYIKEMISSDNGRTKPSVSGLLSCKAVCDELDVISIHDYFLQTIDD